MPEFIVTARAIAACSAKRRYPDMLTALAMGMSRTEQDGVRLYTYQCPVCHGWHLTRDERPQGGDKHACALAEIR